MSFPFFLYAYTTTDLYSLSTTSDGRSISFAQVIGGTEFANFASVYQNYRIKTVTVIVTPMDLQTTCPILYVGYDPTAITGNPTNATLISSDRTHMFSPTATQIKAVTFKSPGIGVSTNIWNSVTVAPNGQINFGNNTSTGLFSSSFVVFDCQLTLQVEFNNPK